MSKETWHLHNAPQTAPAEKHEVVFHAGEEEIKLTPSIVKNYLTNGADITLQEFKLFAMLCKANKLNPFLGEAYIIKFGTQAAQMVVGKNAILQRAGANPNYNGRQQGVIVQNENGEIIERNGAFYTDKEKLVGGWAKVFRKDQEHPTYITVSLSEVTQKTKDGQPNSNWRNKPATMVEKVALVRALREAFPKDIMNMYERDEIVSEEPRASTTESKPQADAFTDDVIDAEAETVSLNDI